MSASRTCAGCGRIVLVEHVDHDGRCCNCQTPKPDKTGINETAFGDVAKSYKRAKEGGDR